MVIGGIAVIAHGVQRMTTDIDAVIRGDALKVAALLEILGKHRIVPRVRNAKAFAAKNLVLLMRHQSTEVDLDLSLGWTAFEREAIAARASTRYGKVFAPMARVEELLVFKAIAGRAHDIDDAVTLLTLYPHVDLKGVRSRVVALADLAEAPELILGLDQIVRATMRLPALPTERPKTGAWRPNPKKKRVTPTGRNKRRKRRARS